MKLWRLQGENVDLWFPTLEEARAEGQTLFAEIVCTAKPVTLPRSKAAMCEFLNTIGGSVP